MRSLKPFLVAAALLFGACASPLDEPLGRQDESLRAADWIDELPACAGLDLSGDAGLVVYEESPGVFVVTAGGTPLCVSDGEGLRAAGVSPEDVLQGTPLPAFTGETADSGDGTPLPAGK